MLISAKLRLMLKELITGRNGKRFAVLAYIMRRICAIIGKPLSPAESNLSESLYYVDKLRHCYSQIDFDGELFYFDLLRLSFDNVLFLINQIHTSDGYLFCEVKNKAPVVFDVGAHIGVFSRHVLNVKPQSTIYAFEPDRQNFYLLKLNSAEFPNFFCYQKGVFNKKDTSELYVSNKIDWRSSLFINPDFKSKFKPDEFLPSYKIDLIDIDSFIKENKITRLDMLKITIGGQIEHLVLEGAKDTIKRFRPQVSMQIYQENERAVESFFKEIGGYVGMKSPYRPSAIVIFKSKDTN